MVSLPKHLRLLVPILGYLSTVLSWNTVRHNSRHRRISLLEATPISSESFTDVIQGTSTFESWFSSLPDADCSADISHCDFGNLRGLSLGQAGKKRLQSGDAMEVMTVPKSIVLSSDLTNVDWDADLAQKLWMECTKGPSSAISGYVTLLARGWTPADLPQLPPSTAPDALRQWTDDEKKLLIGNPAGERLVRLLDQQNELWKSKFSRVNGMTYEQFEWAMEVVHSRAFCGDFGVGNSLLPPAVTAAIPLVAAAVGYQYLRQTLLPDDAVLVGLGVLAAAPTLFNVLQQSPPVAVLLPMIDSINHLEEADSQINYSPLSNAFTLSVGKNCVMDENGKTQLYISYGKKKDTELMLNYGFLRGVSLAGDSSTRRKALAEIFLTRNE